MIDFQKIDPSHRAAYMGFLRGSEERGCEYSFANLNLWGRQQAALLDGYLVFFSQFEKRSIYPHPIGKGDIKPVIEAIIQDAKARGILCRISGLNANQCIHLEELFPGQFRFYPDRDSCDYVYSIEDLATLKGRKYQKKRNHLNKFRENHPNCHAEPITAENLPAVKDMVAQWYARRLEEDPTADFHLEQKAIDRAFRHMDQLGMEGLILVEDGRVIAMTMGSPLSDNTFDIHFEKALEEIDGAYPAINQAFAAHLHNKYPDLQYLDREDDMGLPGLRKAKLSYHPHHLVVKFWARLWEDADED